MGLARKIALSILLVVIVVSGIFLRDAWTWVTVGLAVVFFVGLFWPSRRRAVPSRTR